MSSEIVKRITGMSHKEILEHTWPATTSGTQFIPPRGFSTPADRERMREELRNRPTPKALQPPPSDKPDIFARAMEVFHWWGS